MTTNSDSDFRCLELDRLRSDFMRTSHAWATACLQSAYFLDEWEARIDDETHYLAKWAAYQITQIARLLDSGFQKLHRFEAVFGLANIQLATQMGRDPLISPNDCECQFAASYHELAFDYCCQVVLDAVNHFQEFSLVFILDGTQKPDEGILREAESKLAKAIMEPKRPSHTAANFAPSSTANFQELTGRLRLERAIGISLVSHATVPTHVDPIPLPERPAAPRRLSPEDRRNKWIYEQLCNLNRSAPEIREELHRLCKAKDWPDKIGSNQALYQAGQRYAKKFNKPQPPKRR